MPICNSRLARQRRLLKNWTQTAGTAGPAGAGCGRGGAGNALSGARASPRLEFMTRDGRVRIGRCATAMSTRSGYTGEDGYEITVPNEARPKALWRAGCWLEPARRCRWAWVPGTPLRLEAGLCRCTAMNIDETTTPVEASLLWAIPKHRRDGGGFPGAADGHPTPKSPRDRLRRKIAGLKPRGPRAGAREGTGAAWSARAARKLAVMTSGAASAPASGAGPSRSAYVAAGSRQGRHRRLDLMVRGKAMPRPQAASNCRVVAKLSFAPQR